MESVTVHEEGPALELDLYTVNGPLLRIYHM